MRRRVVLALVVSALVVVPSAASWSWPVSGQVIQAFDFDPSNPYAAGQHRGIDIAAPPGASETAAAADADAAPADAVAASGDDAAAKGDDPAPVDASTTDAGAASSGAVDVPEVLVATPTDAPAVPDSQPADAVPPPDAAPA